MTTVNEVNVATERAAFLAGRRAGIGSSDAPMLAGVSPWGGPWRVWESKVSVVDDSAGPAAEWGRRLESLVAREWAEANGRKIQRRRRQFRSRKWEFAIANPDRFVVGEKALVEVKVVFHRYHDWGDFPDEVPSYVLIQCQHQMAVTDTKRVYVPVFFAGRPESRDYLVERNDAVIADLMDVEQRFWESHVLTGTPPPPDATDDARSGLARQFPTEDGSTITATAEQAAVVAQLVTARADRKEVDGVIQGHENTLKAVMGEATVLLAPAAKVTWRRGTRDWIDWKSIVESMRPAYDDKVVDSIFADHTETKPTDTFRVTPTGGSDDD